VAPASRLDPLAKLRAGSGHDARRCVCAGGAVRCSAGRSLLQPHRCHERHPSCKTIKRWRRWQWRRGRAHGTDGVPRSGGRHGAQGCSARALQQQRSARCRRGCRRGDAKKWWFGWQFCPGVRPNNATQHNATALFIPHLPLDAPLCRRLASRVSLSERVRIRMLVCIHRTHALVHTLTRLPIHLPTLSPQVPRECESTGGPITSDNALEAGGCSSARRGCRSSSSLRR
jgi:hypothetical protein